MKIQPQDANTLGCLDKHTLLKVITAIRESFMMNSPHYAAIVKGALSDKVGPRGGSRYNCAHCKKAFERTAIQIDHKDPVIPVGISPLNMTLQQLYSNCWVTVDKLQVLCKECHNKKSKAENEVRRTMKKKLPI